jgi:sulfate-transporting ATPase
LTVRFGGVVAVDAVDLEVRTGEVMGLIGPNGAGKSTVIDAITGFTSSNRGTISFQQRHIDRWPPHKRSRAGISRSFQSLELFDDVSVLDNIRAACDTHERSAYFTDTVFPHQEDLPATAIACIRDFGLRAELQRVPEELSYGTRRMVAIARAVANGPSILLLDEPAAGLDSQQKSELAALIRRLTREWGLGVLLVEHDMSFVMDLCDRIVVLDFGHKIAEGSPEQVRTNPAVIAAYLGATDTARTRPVPVEP